VALRSIWSNSFRIHFRPGLDNSGYKRPGFGVWGSFQWTTTNSGFEIVFFQKKKGRGNMQRGSTRVSKSGRVLAPTLCWCSSSGSPLSRLATCYYMYVRLSFPVGDGLRIPPTVSAFPASPFPFLLYPSSRRRRAPMASDRARFAPRSPCTCAFLSCVGRGAWFWKTLPGSATLISSGIYKYQRPGVSPWRHSVYEYLRKWKFRVISSLVWCRAWALPRFEKKIFFSFIKWTHFKWQHF
jgi:hypothetical protein